MIRAERPERNVYVNEGIKLAILKGSFINILSAEKGEIQLQIVSKIISHSMKGNRGKYFEPR